MAHDYTRHLKTETKAWGGGSFTSQGPMPASGFHYTQALSPIPSVADGLQTVRSYHTHMINKGLLTLGLVIFYKVGLHKKKKKGLNELFEVFLPVLTLSSSQ